MDNEPTTYGIKMDQYCSILEREGVTIVRGDDARVVWCRGESGAFERHPVFWLELPSLKEIRRCFWRHRAAVVAYIREPDASHPANAWLYVCEDKGYRLEGLKTQVRRNIRRAMQRYRFQYLDCESLRKHGENIFCETRSRIGLSDGTPLNFNRLCDRYEKNPACRILGAWEGDRLAAFLATLVVEDWLTVNVFAGNEDMSSCPNAGLIYQLILEFLVEGKGRVVTFGLSSIQDADNVLTLDYFKRKIGFEAKPIHRVFLIHPFLRPLINPLGYWLLHRLVKLWPRNRVFRKVAGLFASVLGYRKVAIETGSPSAEEE